MFLNKFQLIVGDFFGSIFVYEVDADNRTNKLLRCIESSQDAKLGHIGKINQILKIKENIILTASNYGQIKLWNWNQRQCITSLNYHLNNQNIKFLNIYSNHLLISTTSCGIIHIYDTNCNKVVKTINNQAPIDCLIQLHNGQEIMYTCQNILKVLSLENFQISEVFMMKQRIKSVCQLTSAFFIVGDEQGLLKSLTLLPSENIRHQLNKIKQKFEEMYPSSTAQNSRSLDTASVSAQSHPDRQQIEDTPPARADSRDLAKSRSISDLRENQEDILYFTHTQKPLLTSLSQQKL